MEQCATLQDPSLVGQLTRPQQPSTSPSKRLPHQQNTHTEQRQSTPMRPTQMMRTRSPSPNMRFWKCQMSVGDGGRPRKRRARRALHQAITSSCYRRFLLPLTAPLFFFYCSIPVSAFRTYSLKDLALPLCHSFAHSYTGMAA